MPGDTIGFPQSKFAVTPGFPALAPITTKRVGVGSGGVSASVGGAVGTAASTVTFTGTPAAGQIVTVTLTVPNLNTANAGVGSTSVLANASVPVVLVYSVLAADSVTSIAVAVKNLINANANLSALVLATNASGVLTITALTVGVQYPLTATTALSPAADTITVSGTLAAGRLMTITITPINGPVVTILYTTTAGDSSTTILAASIVVAINNSPAVTGGANALPVIILATSSTNVITLLSVALSSFSNSIALTAVGASGSVLTVGAATFSGGGTSVVATANSAALDLANTVDPNSTFANVQPGSTGAVTFYQGIPTDVDAATKTDLRAQLVV